MTGRTHDVCVHEARYALMAAALRACIARESRDDVALAMWRGRADVAREYMRAASGESPHLALPAAA